uniref:Uncharacterized protein n=1 Tax=Verrucosispora sp. MS100047 TaxID=1410949 RepID=A0A097CTB9_9ACTN|nr:hypothetical protein VASRM7_661 [Verrucosispora sp. MS100047]
MAFPTVDRAVRVPDRSIESYTVDRSADPRCWIRRAHY